MDEYVLLCHMHLYHTYILLINSISQYSLLRALVNIMCQQPWLISPIYYACQHPWSVFIIIILDIVLFLASILWRSYIRIDYQFCSKVIEKIAMLLYTVN